ncbi:asparagine synthase (glutamine-hydrolyzing) [Mycobacterium sp. 1245852.3]|uniref:asparagine synthase (glutamine-hydrolyzing) n=1 Tax=Mycobacterium sp. 1245852.3 TaxID=1856860 RepID=UPI0007FD05A5|nr:asparagine synthase (glutamine-hydrolyzing) [Mycobacterium sp. 1245852.3]OBJ85815.1 asparagine synthase (glutamine-hydrolyzing) [Mycobacterium sp. 1245852.3]
MCGITGWIAFARDLTREREVLDAMTLTMACRGPDASGAWSEPNAALGHRRLAVIDLPGGAQPMSVSTPTGDVVMVYSGEVYNFTELRDELVARGERFRTSSDTEAVLRGYLHWGDAVADRLNGMYAFAIWDARHRKLVMIRDRMGIKPFYFYPTSDGVLFGSEPKAILANPLAKRAVDVEGLREILLPIKTPKLGIWKGMREVEPGTIVTVDDRGIRERTYWRLESRLHTDDQETTVRRVRELLDDIVRRQLVADVPQCVLLSGGLDSSSITVLAARELSHPVRSFSVDFAGQAENFTRDELRPTWDSPFARDVSTHVHSEHTEIVLDANDLADQDVRRNVVTARDLPGGNADLDASLYLLFKAIRGHSTVALSGESADEVFGGYAHFHDPVMQHTDDFPWLAVVGTIMGDISAQMCTEPLRSALDLDAYKRDRYADAVREVSRVDGEDDFTHRMRVMSYLHLTRFLRRLLDRKDRMSMAVGLEVRVPYCDHRLVEYVYNTPWSLKTFDGREKSLLRGATHRLLPASVVQRVKAGYPSTADPKYGAQIQRQAKHLLVSENDALFALIERSGLEQLANLDPQTLSGGARGQMEQALDLATWLDLYEAEIVF